MKIFTLIFDYGKKFPISSQIGFQVSNYHYTSLLIFHKKYLSCATKILETQSYDDKAKKELEEWLEVQKSKSKYVPEKISENLLHLLLDADSVQQRYNILFHSCRQMNYAQSKAIQNKVTKRKNEDSYAVQNCSHIKYNLWNNAMFPRVYKSAMVDLIAQRFMSAAINSQPLIIDLAFEDNMNSDETKLLKRELLSSIDSNLKCYEPVNLMLCNAKPGKLLQLIERRLPKNFPMVITSKSYLEFFTKEKFIYLTKDATEEMDKFDNEAIYIIGGLVELVDGSKRYPATYEKANNEGIRTQRLPLTSIPDTPLNKHITLNISDVFHMLLELHSTGSWKNVHKNIPDWQIDRLNSNPRISFGIDESIILFESIR